MWAKAQATISTTMPAATSAARTVIYERIIGEQSYYAIQTAVDTKKTSLHIVSAFIGKSGYKKGVSQTLDAKGPEATPKSENVGTPINSIPQNAEKVNTLGEKSAVNQHPVAIEVWAKENIPEYAKLSEPNKQAVRMTIRQARAYGLDADEIKVYARVAARSGLNIVFDAKSTQGSDGLFDGRNTIYINPDAPVERRHSKLLHENVSCHLFFVVRQGSFGHLCKRELYT